MTNISHLQSRHSSFRILMDSIHLQMNSKEIYNIALICRFIRLSALEDALAYKRIWQFCLSAAAASRTCELF